MREAVLHGDGLAISACARLLGQAGWRVGRVGSIRPKLPVVLLNQQSQVLLRDLFGSTTLLEGWHGIERRIVRWGGETVDLPHEALAVDEAQLLERIGALPEGSNLDGYHIYGARPLPEDTGEQAMGERLAELAAVRLQPGVSGSTCWVEAVEEGWLFAVGMSSNRAWLIGVGGGIGQLLEQSILIRPAIGEIERSAGRFASHPRMAKVLAGHQWLACGSAAMSFDPICGEGTGHAMREAILAGAVLKAHARGEPWQELADLYQQRLRGGFARHVELCRQLYTTGGTGNWWRQQAATLQPIAAGIGPTAFRLSGFDLERAP